MSANIEAVEARSQQSPAPNERGGGRQDDHQKAKADGLVGKYKDGVKRAGREHRDEQERRQGRRQGEGGHSEGGSYGGRQPVVSIAAGRA